MAKFSRESPFNNLPGLPPLKDVESREILKKAIGVYLSFSRLARVIDRLPKSKSLMEAIGLADAKFCSGDRISQPTRDELFQARFKDEETGPGLIKEALDYNLTLWASQDNIKEKKQIDAGLLVKNFQGLTGLKESYRNEVDTRIFGKNDELLYMPPSGTELITQKCQDLLEYINKETGDTDPLVRLAIIHYQFAAIHPFSDGNRRSGLILAHLFLQKKGFIEWPVLPLGQILGRNKATYEKLIIRVTEENKWKPWVLFFLDLLDRSAVLLYRKVESIRQLSEKQDQLMKERAADIYSKQLGELIISHPYCKRRFLEESGIVKKKTAGLYLGKLEKTGLLKSVRVGKEKLYINRAFMEILENE